MYEFGRFKISMFKEQSKRQMSFFIDFFLEHFIAKLSGKYRVHMHPLSPHTNSCPAPHQSGTFVTADESSLTYRYY